MPKQSHPRRKNEIASLRNARNDRFRVLSPVLLLFEVSGKKNSVSSFVPLTKGTCLPVGVCLLAALTNTQRVTPAYYKIS